MGANLLAIDPCQLATPKRRSRGGQHQEELLQLQPYGLRALKRELVLKRPALVDTTLYKGHTMVLIGYNDVDKILYFIDPNIAAPGLRELTTEQFSSIWNLQGVETNMRGAAFTAPASNSRR